MKKKVVTSNGTGGLRKSSVSAKGGEEPAPSGDLKNSAVNGVVSSGQEAATPSATNVGLAGSKQGMKEPSTAADGVDESSSSSGGMAGVPVIGGGKTGPASFGVSFATPPRTGGDGARPSDGDRHPSPSDTSRLSFQGGLGLYSLSNPQMKTSAGPPSTQISGPPPGHFHQHDAGHSSHTCPSCAGWGAALMGAISQHVATGKDGKPIPAPHPPQTSPLMTDFAASAGVKPRVGTKGVTGITGQSSNEDLNRAMFQKHSTSSFFAPAVGGPWRPFSLMPGNSGVGDFQDAAKSTDAGTASSSLFSTSPSSPSVPAFGGSLTNGDWKIGGSGTSQAPPTGLGTISFLGGPAITPVSSGQLPSPSTTAPQLPQPNPSFTTALHDLTDTLKQTKNPSRSTPLWFPNTTPLSPPFPPRIPDYEYQSPPHSPTPTSSTSVPASNASSQPDPTQPNSSVTWNRPIKMLPKKKVRPISGNFSEALKTSVPLPPAPPASLAAALEREGSDSDDSSETGSGQAGAAGGGMKKKAGNKKKKKRVAPGGGAGTGPTNGTVVAANGAPQSAAAPSFRQGFLLDPIVAATAGGEAILNLGLTGGASGENPASFGPSHNAGTTAQSSDLTFEFGNVFQKASATVDAAVGLTAKKSLFDDHHLQPRIPTSDSASAAAAAAAALASVSPSEAALVGQMARRNKVGGFLFEEEEDPEEAAIDYTDIQDIRDLPDLLDDPELEKLREGSQPPATGTAPSNSSTARGSGSALPPPDTGTTTSKNNKKKKKKKHKKKEEGTNHEGGGGSPQSGDSPTTPPAAEKKDKKRKRADGGVEGSKKQKKDETASKDGDKQQKGESEGGDDGSKKQKKDKAAKGDEKTSKEKKKEKKVAEKAETDADEKPSKEKKKDKKAAEKAAGAVKESAETTADEKPSKEKKKDKKAAKKAAAAATEAAEAKANGADVKSTATQQPTTTTTSSTKDDGEKQPQQAVNTAPPASTSAGSQARPGWNDWSKASFDGNAARHEKFLRLLGAKKGTSPASPAASPAASSPPAKTAINKSFEKKMEKDMVEQFEKGREITQKMRQGKRGGLGFSG
ncbi:hypothetical protein HK104_003398 [Borealophlyctis nickersoniae]|nr:hypothetical protein HK104_003398 [Borealophlyctis nickersoniae]